MSKYRQSFAPGSFDGGVFLGPASPGLGHFGTQVCNSLKNGDTVQLCLVIDCRLFQHVIIDCLDSQVLWVKSLRLSYKFVGKSSSWVQEFADLRRSLGSFLITLPRKTMPLKTKIKMPGVTVKAINAIQVG